jgi:hypothetical protein
MQDATVCHTRFKIQNSKGWLDREFKCVPHWFDSLQVPCGSLWKCKCALYLSVCRHNNWKTILFNYFHFQLFPVISWLADEESKKKRKRKRQRGLFMKEDQRKVNTLLCLQTEKGSRKIPLLHFFLRNRFHRAKLEFLAITLSSAESIGKNHTKFYTNLWHRNRE